VQLVAVAQDNALLRRCARKWGHGRERKSSLGCWQATAL
jgi:hypothetical protein